MAISLRDDAVGANRKRNDDVAIDDEQNAVLFGDIQIENLVAMPENAGEFVTVQRRMPPVRREQGELRTSGTFNLGRKISKLSLKSNRAPIDHKSSTVSFHRMVIPGLNRIILMFLNVLEIFGGGFTSRNARGKEYRVERNLFRFPLHFRGRFHQIRK